MTRDVPPGTLVRNVKLPDDVQAWHALAVQDDGVRLLDRNGKTAQGPWSWVDLVSATVEQVLTGLSMHPGVVLRLRSREPLSVLIPKHIAPDYPEELAEECAWLRSTGAGCSPGPCRVDCCVGYRIMWPGRAGARDGARPRPAGVQERSAAITRPTTLPARLSHSQDQGVDAAIEHKTMNTVAHAAFRRDLARFERAFDDFPAGQQERASQLKPAWDWFSSELHHHHDYEETYFWPALRQTDATLPTCLNSTASTRRCAQRWPRLTSPWGSSPTTPSLRAHGKHTRPSCT